MAPAGWSTSTAARQDSWEAAEHPDCRSAFRQSASDIAGRLTPSHSGLARTPHFLEDLTNGPGFVRRRWGSAADLRELLDFYDRKFSISRQRAGPGQKGLSELLERLLKARPSMPGKIRYRAATFRHQNVSGQKRTHASIGQG